MNRAEIAGGSDVERTVRLRDGLAQADPIVDLEIVEGFWLVHGSALREGNERCSAVNHGRPRWREHAGDAARRLLARNRDDLGLGLDGVANNHRSHKVQYDAADPP